MDNLRYELECRLLEHEYFLDQTKVRDSFIKQSLYKMKWFFKRIWRR